MTQPIQAPPRVVPRGLVALLTLTVGINAALLFSVEPMFAKMVLPLLGGTPSVWNTCLVFFQGALLVGYVYAHLSTRLLRTRRHVLVHMSVLALSCIVLPLQLRAHGDPPAGGMAILWLLALLTISLGLPFVLLASGALVAQRWFADSRHPAAANPYFLYAASNLGSLLALLSYPFLIEPWLPLSQQRAAWSVAYLALVALVGVCAWMVTRGRFRPEGATPATASPRSRIRAADRLRWVLYSAVPSGLLLAVTNYLSTDVAAVPLLWILPLAVYLLTFVLVFATRQWLPYSLMVRVEAQVLILAAVPIYLGFRIPALPGIVLHLILLFVVAMVCHGELARRKPDAAQLTEFFVWVSIGGLVGGIFGALVAPLVFDDVLEYPILLALAATLRPAATDARSRHRLLDFLVPIALFAALLAARIQFETPSERALVFVTVVAAGVIFRFRDRPVHFSFALAALMLAGYAASARGGTTILHRERSYFGVYRVKEEATVRLLEHGTTLHGAQSLRRGQELEPLTYYHREGPAGDVFARTSAAKNALRRVGVVGLGTGSLACYGRLGEQWTFYEIDPVVASIAGDPRLFTFLRDCRPTADIVLGDARLKLQVTAPAQYDILVLDAFSSDAIPVHLLTREALKEYLTVLAKGGVLAFHISNRHLDLEPVLSAAAGEAGLVSRVRRDNAPAAMRDSMTRSSSDWVIVARTDEDLGELAADARWQPLRRRAGMRPWTDDFSNILRVMRWNWRR